MTRRGVFADGGRIRVSKAKKTSERHNYELRVNRSLKKWKNINAEKEILAELNCVVEHHHELIKAPNLKNKITTVLEYLINVIYLQILIKQENCKNQITR